MNNMNLRRRVCSKAGGASLLLMMSAPILFAAQSVLMSPPSSSSSDTTPSWSDEESSENEMDVFIPATDLRRSSDEPFTFGPLIFRPHVDYNFNDASGIQSGTNNPQRSIIQTLSPGMTVDLGKHWTADYTPTLTFYSNRQFKNTLNNAASLNGATRYDDWTFSLSQTYNFSSTPLTETAQQTEQTDYATALNATYALSDRWLATFGLNQNISDNPGFNSSKTWSTIEGLDYTFWRRLTVGVNAGGGFVDVSPASGQPAGQEGNQYYETLNGDINWRATDKISLSLSAGLEDQQFTTAGLADTLSPVFSASIEYLPFQHTQISLSASRSIGSSDFYIQTSSQTTTSVALSLNQRLFKKFNLNLSANYSENDYTQGIELFGDKFASGRTDDTYTFNASVSRSFLKRGTVSVTYQYSRNTSTAEGFSYNSNQVGVQVGYSY